MNDVSFPILHVDELRCPITHFDWTFVRENSEAIDSHWNALRAARPALFNGKVFLMHNFRIETNASRCTMQAEHFETDFKNFLAWRDFGFPDQRVKNSFAMAALQGADGGFILGRMGEHTSNAGLVYFPAGTPDRDDICGDVLDFERSARRELAEETGLGLDGCDSQFGWSVVLAGPRLACMKAMRSEAPALALQQQARAFLALQEEPELSDVLVASHSSHIDPAVMPDFMLAFLRARLTV